MPTSDGEPLTKLRAVKIREKPEAKANLKLPIDPLVAAVLTNYISEWQQGSYGDSGWALRAGAEFALYDRLPEA